MKKYLSRALAIVTLFTPVCVLAETNGGVVQEAECLKSEIEGLVHPLDHCQGEVAPRKNFKYPYEMVDLIIACQTEICGPFTADNNYHLRVQQANAKKRKPGKLTEAETYFKDSLKTRLSEVFDLNLNQSVRNLEAIREVIDQPVIPEEPRPPLSENFDFFMMNRHYIRFLPPTSHLDPPKVDVISTRGNLHSLPENKRAHFLKLAQEYYSLPEISDVTDYFAMGHDRYLQAKYPGLKPEDALKAEADQLLKFREKLKSTEIDPALALKSVEATLQKASATGILNPLEQATFGGIKDNLSSRWMLHSNSASAETFRISPPSMVLTDSIRQAFKANIQNVLNSVRDPNLKLTSLAHCQSAFLAGMQEAPQSAMVKRWKKIEQEAKIQIAESIIPKFSRSTQEHLRKSLAAIELELPMDRDQYRTHVDSSLTQAKRMFQDIDKYSEELKKNYAMMVKLSKFDELDQVIARSSNPSLPMASMCSQFGPKGVLDNARSRQGKIQISPVAVTAGPVGKGILLHEIGHVLSAALEEKSSSEESMKKFKNVRSCLSQKHSDEINFQPERHVEEDWADLVAFEASIPVDRSPTCFLLTPTATDPMSSIDLDQQRYGVPHSSEFFRALHSYQVRHGSLPKTCNKMLRNLPVKYDFSSCFKATF